MDSRKIISSAALEHTIYSRQSNENMDAALRSPQQASPFILVMNAFILQLIFLKQHVLDYISKS